MYMDPHKPGPVPLVYMGFDEEFPVLKGQVCERWIGPAGEHVYHIHAADHPRWDTIAGGDFLRRKAGDWGTVYVFLTSPTYYWSVTALKSVISRFPKAKVRCLTITEGFCRELDVLECFDEPITEKERNEIAWIVARPEGTQQMRAALQLDFSDRFLAKVALGLCHTILGSRAIRSSYAESLRRLLWRFNTDGAEEVQLRGTDYWHEVTASDCLSELFGWPGAWTILVQPMPDAFALVISTPRNRLMTMALSDQPSVWPKEALSRHGQGSVFVIIPERSHCTGEIALLDYLRHRQGVLVHPALAIIDGMRTDPADLPARRPVDEADLSIG